MTYLDRTIGLILADPMRMACLDAVSQLDCPDAMIAAGFLRNLIWDALHGYAKPTPLNDIDVVYFDASDTSLETEIALASQLAQGLPDICWQVRNQARMHLRNGHAPYKDCCDAISYFPEIETCLGVRQHIGRQSNGKSTRSIDLIAPYGLAYNWQLTITQNPRPNYPLSTFMQRVPEKKLVPRLAQTGGRQRGLKCIIGEESNSF